MLSTEVIEQIKDQVETLGYQFWGIESQNMGSSQLLQVFVDKSGGIQLDDCEQVSRHLGSFLDVEDFISFKYTLEVSSPGVNRRFYHIHQCLGYEDEQVKIKLRPDIFQRRNYKTILTKVDVEQNQLTFIYNDQALTVDFNDIEKINLSYKW